MSNTVQLEKRKKKKSRNFLKINNSFAVSSGIFFIESQKNFLEKHAVKMWAHKDLTKITIYQKTFASKSLFTPSFE